MNSDIKKETRPVAAGTKRVETTVEGDKVIIRSSIYETDLGWCCQKTVTLDAEMADDLFEALASARFAARDANDDILSADFLEIDR